MKEIKIFFSSIFIVLLLSGCIFDENGKKIIEQVKLLPEVEEFLAENPDAEVKAILLGKEVVEDNIDNLRYYCGQGMEVKSYWNVVIERGKKGLEIWVDEEGGVVCILEKGKEKVTTTTTSTTSSTTTMTSTSTTSTSTTTSTTTTSTSTTTTISTTTIIGTTSTTICTVECCSDADCPPNQITKNYTCSGDEIRRQYINYICRYAGSPSAECVGKMGSEFIKSCGGENERCLEDEPYCAFTSSGQYYITPGVPPGSDALFVNDANFHQYLGFWIKIKYVISNFKGSAPDGLCLYVKDSQVGEARRAYLTDKFFGNWINDTVRVGVKKIFIGDGISAELWGMKA